jgi:hypothetical protein
MTPGSFLAGLLMMALTAVAAGPDAGTTLGPREYARTAEPSRVQLGESFLYEVVLKHPTSERYELRTSDLGAFELVEQKRRREDGPQEATTTFQLTMVLFELGPHTIPEMVFEVTTPEGIRTWTLPGVEVEGQGVLPANAEQDGANLKDLKPLAEVPVRTYRLLAWIAGALALAALAWALKRYWKKLRPKPVVPAAPPLPLHVRTKQALDALASEDLPGKGRNKDFYFRLSEILRAYLGERYGFEALESTRSELMESLRKRHTPGLPMEAFIAFEAEAELVKFAKAEVGPLQCKSALELAYRLVESTPFPVAEKAEAATS